MGVSAGLLLGIGALLLVLLATAVVLGVTFSSQASSPMDADGVSVPAEREIPPAYLGLYRRAAAHYGLDWAILAGIGKVECDHGRDPAPSCTQQGAVNSAGAGGPMQFLASTWSEYGVDADGEGPPDRWDPADAIFGAANYLRASGAPRNYHEAIFAYNHAGWYVAEVEHWAELYASSIAAAVQEPDDGAVTGSTAPVQYIEGERARLSPADGHVALIPTGVPPVARRKAKEKLLGVLKPSSAAITLSGRSVSHSRRCALESRTRST